MRQDVAHGARRRSRRRRRRRSTLKAACGDPRCGMGRRQIGPTETMANMATPATATAMLVMMTTKSGAGADLYTNSTDGARPVAREPPHSTSVHTDALQRRRWRISRGCRAHAVMHAGPECRALCRTGAQRPASTSLAGCARKEARPGGSLRCGHRLGPPRRGLGGMSIRRRCRGSDAAGRRGGGCDDDGLFLRADELRARSYRRPSSAMALRHCFATRARTP